MDKFEETIVNPNIYRQADKTVYYSVNDDKDLTAKDSLSDSTKHSLQADAYIFAAIAAIIASSVIILLQQ